MTEPLFSSLDVDRILRRAAEIEGSEDGRRLTVDEIRSIAGEAGFGPQAVERAIAEVRAAGPVGARRPPVQKSGFLRTRFSILREIPVTLTSDEIMRAVRLFQPYRSGPARVKLEEHEITWKGQRGLRFAVSSAGGMTEIRVWVAKLTLRNGRWMGWVKAAADRLETLVWLVGDRESRSGGRQLPP